MKRMRQILNVNENPGSIPAPRSDGGKCGDLRKSGPGCNDLVGAAADIVEALM